MLVALWCQHMIKENSSNFFSVTRRSIISATWWPAWKWVKLQFECPSNRRRICSVSLEPKVKGYIIIQMLNPSDQWREKNCSWLSLTLSIYYIPTFFLNYCSIFNVVYAGMLDCSHSQKREGKKREILIISFAQKRIFSKNMEL